MSPTLIMLAGPNGAGKTTFYNAFLADKGLPFINADRLAKELELQAYDAADFAARVRTSMLLAGESFITETVFSDPVGDKLNFLTTAVKHGYVVTLFFIGLATVRLSRERIATRVAAGGHDVPSDKLAGRYQRSLVNLKKATRLVPRVVMYDNSEFGAPFQFVAEFRNGRCVQLASNVIPKWAAPIVRARAG